MMRGLVGNILSSFQNVHRHFASLSAFCLPPNYPRVTPVKTCGSTTGNKEGSSRMYCYSGTKYWYLDHNKWLIFVLSLYFPGWHTGH